MFERIDIKKCVRTASVFWVAEKYLDHESKDYSQRFNVALETYKTCNKKERLKIKNLLGTKGLENLNLFMDQEGYTARFK